jgi:hypothetical protein
MQKMHIQLTIAQNDVHDVPDFEFASKIGQGSDSNGFSVRQNLFRATATNLAA